MFGKEFQKQREVSGRGRVDQALFGLNKFDAVESRYDRKFSRK